MKQWCLQVVTGRASYPVDLSSNRKISVARLAALANGIDDPSATDRHAFMVVREGGVWIETIHASVSVYVNDVLIRGSLLLRRGDEIRVGQSVFVLTERFSEPKSPSHIADADELLRRLDEEVDRTIRAHQASPSSMRSVGLLAIVEPPVGSSARQAFIRRAVELIDRHGVVATWARFGIDLLCCVLVDCTEEQLQRIENEAVGLAAPRARAAMVIAPRDAVGAEALLGAMWRSLHSSPNEESVPHWADPVMVRLAHSVSSVASPEGSLCLVGGEGVGRVTLARMYLKSLDVTAEVISCLDADFEKKLTQIDSDRWLILRDFDPEIPSPLTARRGRPPRRVICTSSKRPAVNMFESVFEVPALTTRPDDIALLAEHFLSNARRLLSRPKLSQSDDVSRLLQLWHWPGNVRELENVMIRAARGSMRDEIGRDALPARMLRDAPARDFVSAIDDAERSILLESLARTRWNVSAAATRLQLPRRTLVHRMARLGLRRPTR